MADLAHAARLRPADDGQRLDLLLRLGDLIRPLDHAAEIEAAVTRLLGEAFGADHVGFARYRADGGELVVDCDWTRDGIARLTGRHEPEELGVDLAPLRDGRPDVRAGVVSLPLLQAGELRALLFLRFADGSTIDGRDLDLLRGVAERAWLSIDNVRCREALRENEVRLAAALESVPVGVAMVDGGGRIVVANAAYRRFLPSGYIPSCDPVALAKWRAWSDDGEALPPSEFPGARAMRGERTVPDQEMLFRGDADQEIWTRVASVPVYDDDGRINGQVSVISDIDALKRGSDALRESQARAQLLIDGIAQATWEAAPDGLVEADSPSWRAYTGQSYDEWRGHGWLDAIHPDDRTATMQKWQETVREQRAVDAEYRLRGADGRYRWMNVRAVPFRDAAGHVTKWLGMNIDIDERKRLAEAVHDNERRTRALMEGVPQLLWRANRAAEWSWASPQWTAFTGQSEEESRGRGWLAMVHPDDRELVLAAWSRAEADGGVEVEHRIGDREGRYRWFATRAVPVRDGDGCVVEWLGTGNDIDALRRARERQNVLVAELQHRTRNLIAVVRSLSDKTLDGATSLGEFEAQFNDRLSALARVQGLLSHATAGRKVTFDELLRSELLALGALGPEGGAERVRLNGPAGVPLRSGAVQTLSLALHELATNAVKYGALRPGAGTLDVAWSVETGLERPILAVEWRERGVTLPDVDVRAASQGYGRELIERALPYQLGAETSYSFTDDGLCCTIRVPIVATRQGEEGR